MSPPQSSRFRTRPNRTTRDRPAFIPRGLRLEDRILLAADPLAGLATPLSLGTPTTGTLAANTLIFYQITPTIDGRLTAQVHAPGGATRLTLMNAQGQTLFTSEGQSLSNPDPLLDIHVAAGTDYLEVQNLGTKAAFTLTTVLTPASTPFQPIPGGVGPASIVASDFNGDGRIDLAVANSGGFISDGTVPGSVSVLLGNGDGTFQNPVLYPVGPDPIAIVAGDFTGVGRTDLAVVDEGSYDVLGGVIPGTSSVSILLGNGDGTFQKQVTYAVGDYPSAIVAGDFTGDGRTDLAVANEFDNTVSILLGNGDGTFQKQVTYQVGSYPDALVAGDFNGDGRTDLAVASGGFSNLSLDGGLSVLLGNGDGTFQNQVTYAAGDFPTAIVAGDFTGDGRTDLAVADASGVSVLLGNGDGTFQNQVSYTLVNIPTALVAGDFNGDGRTDLAVAYSGSNEVSILLGNGDGTFQNQVSYQVGSYLDALVAGDFNGDGRTDLAVSDDNGVSVLLGNGDGTFQNQITNAVGGEPSAIVAGDFTGDGRTDLAVANEVDKTVSILLGNGDGTFQKQVTYQVGSYPDALVAGDFNGDGRTDLAVANDYDNDVSILLGNGDGTFQNQVTYAVGDYPSAIVAGDFTGDGRTDLAVANGVDKTVSILLGNGDGTFQKQVTYQVGGYPGALVAGDFNGDGRTDLAVASGGFSIFSLDGGMSVLLGNGDGTFQKPITSALGTPSVALVTGDFTGDGRTDLVLAYYGLSDVSILLSHGDFTFQKQLTYLVGSGVGALVAGDFTGDGRTDFAVVNRAVSDSDGNPVPGSVSVLLGNGDGTFQNPVTSASGTNPGALVAGDFTGDGRTDLAVVNEGDSTVSLLQGKGDGTFTDAGQEATALHATPIVADVNGHGTDDVLVVDAAGAILYRQGIPGEPGSFQPPVTINPGKPARDMAYVSTPLGPVVAAVDSRDDAVSLYEYRGWRLRLGRVDSDRRLARSDHRGQPPGRWRKRPRGSQWGRRHPDRYPREHRGPCLERQQGSPHRDPSRGCGGFGC